MKKSFDIASLLNVPKLPKYLLLVEEELNKAVSSDNAYLSVPIGRLIRARSKRLRPSLLIAIVVNQGVKINQRVISSCVAVELVHLASLVHDDIIDEAEIRWGVPTINAKEGISTAIIVGDYLFAKANQQAIVASPDIAKIISRTVELLCQGEINEMADEFDVERSVSSLIKTMEGKTAALVSATCQIGGICAGLSKLDVNSLYNYGRAFGISFQVIDDLLDLLSTPELLGKPIGNDVKEGVYTLPLVLAIASDRGKEVRQLLKIKNQSADSALTNLLLDNGAINKSIIFAHEYNKLARIELKNLKDTKVKSGLMSIPDNYMAWALNYLVDDKYRPAVSKKLKSVINS